MVNHLSIFTALSFFSYVPIVSYLDMKYRNIRSHYLWIPLIATNIPCLLLGYWSGTYPLHLAVISIINSVLWFILLWFKKLKGADFAFLVLISVFMVLNPFTDMPFMLMFSFYLIGFTAATFWYVFLDNLIRKRKVGLTMDRGIPFLVTISCALIAAMVI